MEHLTELELTQLLDTNIKTFEFTDEDREQFTSNFNYYRNRYENVEWNSELAYLYTTMEKKLKRYPGWLEYCKKYCEISWEHCKKYELDEVEQKMMKHDIAWRASRTWIGLTVEQVLKLQLLSWGYDIVAHEFIDVAMGVDIVAIDNKGKLTYIHVTKNTDGALNKVNKKEKKITGSGFKRDFSNHLVLAYDIEESEKNIMVGALPVFKKEYVLEQLKTVKCTETVKENRLTELAYFYRNRVNKDGRFKFKSKKGLKFGSE